MSDVEWLDQLAVAEEHLIPTDLRRAAEFLRLARNPSEGWGDYPGVPTDLHATAQVMGALQALKHPKARELAASVAAWAHRHYEEQPPATVQDALSLLILAAADRETEGSYPEKLRASLHAALKNLDNDQLSTLTLAQAVLSTELWPDEHRKQAGPWVQELVRRGQGADAWDKAGLPEESLPVTALAVRALASWREQQNSTAAVIERGLEHIRSHIFEHGWSSSALSSTYVLSLILRALAYDTDGEPELFKEGWDLLRSRQCSDGGWTAIGATHGTSSVEHTAAAMTALAESGGCRYVSLLATRGVIRQLTNSLDEATRRKAALEEDIEGQVEQRLGKAINERDQLRRRLKHREAEVVSLRKRIDEAKSAPDSVSPKWNSLRIRLLVALLSLILLTGGTIVLYTRFTFSSIILSYILTGLAIIPFSWYIFVYMRQISRRTNELESISARQSQRLVEEFLDATEDLPVSAREEFVYRLAREGTDLPPDLFLRFLTELTSKQLRIDRNTNRRLRGWMEKFATMEPKDRRTLIVQLRRTIL